MSLGSNEIETALIACSCGQSMKADSDRTSRKVGHTIIGGRDLQVRYYRQCG